MHRVTGICSHLTLWRNQELQFQRCVSHPVAGALYTSFDFAECRSLPQGPVRGTTEYFAGSRLGFSVFVCRVWTCHFVEWHILVSRALEKTGLYAVACLNEVYHHRESMWEGIFLGFFCLGFLSLSKPPQPTPPQLVLSNAPPGT